MLESFIDSIEQKKAQLDRLRPLSAAALGQLQKHYDVELTYTSNAIEGNTLTLRETAEVIDSLKSRVHLHLFYRELDRLEFTLQQINAGPRRR